LCRIRPTVKPIQKAQQDLLLRVQRFAPEKSADVDFGYLPARRRIRFMPDEGPAGLAVDAKKPSVSIRAAVEDSAMERHTGCFRRFLLKPRTFDRSAQ
jgi:hypothetical protein